VTITATHQTTKASKTSTTGNDGGYSISLAPGTYSIVAAVPGFRRHIQNVEVATGTPKQLDFSLEAQLTEEVTVTATKRALLSFDRERGTSARIGYRTNQPRTFGVSTRFDF
jgi:hypothetical protein